MRKLATRRNEMKNLLMMGSLAIALPLLGLANGGPAATGIREEAALSRGTAGIDERDLDSTSPRRAEAKKKSTREAARENARNGSFPGSFGTLDRQQEEIAPAGPPQFEDIKRDPYMQGRPVVPENKQ
jgi:hypothetical protein